MSSSITAGQIAERLRGRNGDGFVAGDPGTVVTGIATTFVPSLEVLRRAAAAGRNMIVSQESPYWNRNAKALAEDPVFRAKQAVIDEHRLVVYRLRDGWKPGLAKALGWGGAEGVYFQRPRTTLAAMAREVTSKLGVKAARVIGDPGIAVTKVAVTHGMITTPQLAKVLEEPGVDAVVIGEPVEWEASPYFQDVIASGQKKGLIVIGLEASEEPGGGEVAAWLKSIISEVPVEWMPAGEPFSARRWA